MKKIYIIFLLLYGFFGYSQEQTMYWIGGNGDWDQLNHWSLQSGNQAIIMPSSVPTSETNVIIDENSGFGPGGEINVTATSDIVIKSLTFKDELTQNNTPIIRIGTLSTANLVVTGDVKLQPYVQIKTGSSFLIMRPAANVTTNFYSNGVGANNYVFDVLKKQGAGTTIVDDPLNYTSIYVESGLLKLSGTHVNNNYIQVNNTGELSFTDCTEATVENLRVSNNAVVNFPLCTKFSGLNVWLDNSGILNLPLCTELNSNNFELKALSKINADAVTKISGGMFNFLSGQTTNFPNLIEFGNTGTSEAVNVNGNSGTLVLGTDTNVVATQWTYTGDLIANNSVFNITNGIFSVKSNTAINKVNFTSPSNSNTSLSGENATFKEVIVANNGVNINFKKNLSIENLTLSAGGTATLDTGITVSVTNSFNLNVPDCTPYATISGAGTSSNQPKLKIDIATLPSFSIHNINIQNINFTGTTLLNIIGFEIGSNTGNYSISSPTSKTIYWVGDVDTDWNNIGNWSLTSGGSGGECLPTRVDNVVFDDNSQILGPTISIGSSNTAVHNITITDTAPVFGLTGLGNFTCTGSWRMRSDMQINCKVFFTSETLNETITSNGSYFTNTVTFDGIGGWIFQDRFEIRGLFHLDYKSGTINTNNQEVHLGGYFNGRDNSTLVTTYKNLILGSSTIYVYSNWRFANNSTLYTLDAGTSHIIINNSAVIEAQTDHIYNNITAKATFSLSNTYGNLTANILIVEGNSAIFNKQLNVNELKFTSASLLKIDFKDDVVIHNLYEVHSLYEFLMNKNKTFTIEGVFSANIPDCIGLSRMSTSDSSGYFTFKSFNDVNIPNVWFSNVHASTDITTINYSATGFLGNEVVGWNFTSNPSKDLYWIGTVSSDWNIANNWTLNSDGTASGGCVPTINDNVHFNSYSAARLTVITNKEINIKNFISHADAPSNMSIGSILVNMNVYGNFMSLADKMIVYNNINLKGIGEFDLVGLQTNVNRLNQLNITSSITLCNMSGKLYIPGDLTIAPSVTVDGTNNSELEVSGTIQNEGTFIFPNKLTAKTIYFKAGTLNFENANINLSQGLNEGFSDPGTVFATNRSLNIKNSNITTGSWITSITPSPNFILETEGSYLKVSGPFKDSSIGNTYNIVEFIHGLYSSIPSRITIGTYSKFNEIILASNRRVSAPGEIETKKLTILPRNLTLYLGRSIKVTEDLYISGNACAPNVIQWDNTENVNPGIREINYLNPNNNNKFDFVRVENVSATGAPIILDVNSTLSGTTTGFSQVNGTPGLVGLGADRTCETSNSILAYGFYGGPRSTYKWYKKNQQGTYVQLNVPLETTVLDASLFGYDGEYKVDMIYDTTAPVLCEQTSDLTITFKPPTINFDVSPLDLCADENITFQDLSLPENVVSYLQNVGGEIKWYNAATGGLLIPSTSLVTTGSFYATISSANGCESELRGAIQIVLKEAPVANAGPDQIIVGVTDFTMSANNPTLGTGTWSVVSGNATIENPTSYNTIVHLVSGDNAILKWTVNNGGCMKYDQLVIGNLPININKVRVNPSLRQRIAH